MDGIPVGAGDFFYVPSGTMHGAGITLIGSQQNADVTYRVFDYGRPRELHIDEAIAVLTPAPYARDNARQPAELDTALSNGPIFALMRLASRNDRLDSVKDRRRWIAPLEGNVRTGGDVASAGECLLVEAGLDVELSASAVMLCGIEGTI